MKQPWEMTEEEFQAARQAAPAAKSAGLQPWEMTSEQVTQAQTARPGLAEDVARSGASGVGRGLVGLPGAPADIAGLVTDVYDWGQRTLSGESAEDQAARLKAAGATSTEDLRKTYGSERMIQGATNLGVPGLNYQPQTPAGEYARTAGEFVGGALPTAGYGAAQSGLRAGAGALVRQGLIPGVASEAAGQGAHKLAPDMPGLETAARVVGGAVPGAALAGGPRRIDVPEVGPVRTKAAANVGETISDMGGPGRAAEEWAQVGPEGRLWDTGPGPQRLGESVYTTPGPQQQPIRDFLQARTESLRGDNSLVAQALDRYVEPKADNFMDQMEVAQTAKRKQANAIFGEAETLAEGKRIDTTPVINYIESRLPTSVAANATDLLPGEQEMLRIRGALSNRTDFRSLKNAKEELDGMIGEAVRAGRNTGPLIEVKRRLVDTLADATTRPNNTSAYREALRTYRNDSEILEAMEGGQKLFERSTRPDQFARDLRDMSDEQRTAMRMGARDNLAKIMDDPANDFSAIQNRLNSNNGRAKMRLLLGEAQADALYDRLQGLARQRGTVQRAEGQSVTAQRTAAQKKVQNPDDPALTEMPISEAPGLGQIATGLLRKMYGPVVKPFVKGGIKETNLDMSRLLTAAPENRAAFLAELQRIYEQQQRFGGRGAAGAFGAYQGERNQ